MVILLTNIIKKDETGKEKRNKYCGEQKVSNILDFQTLLNIVFIKQKWCKCATVNQTPHKSVLSQALNN